MHRNLFLKLFVTSSYLALMLACGSCSHEKNELAHNHQHEHDNLHHDHDHDHDHEGHEGHNHGSGPEIHLEPEMAEKMGVKTDIITPGAFSEVIRTSGRVESSTSGSALAVAPSPGIFTFSNGISVGSAVSMGSIIGSINSSSVTGGDPNTIAFVALENAKRELDRLTPLYEKQLVTADKYNAAVAAYQTAKEAYSAQASSGRVTAPANGTVTELLIGNGEFVQTGTPVVRIADSTTLSLIADVPDRYASVISEINNAMIKLNNNVFNLSEHNGKKISNSAAVSNKPGYIPVVFTFDGNIEGLTVGVPVEAYLLGREINNVLSVPLTAITENQGTYFVYVKVDDEGYLKSPVKTGTSDGKRIEILSGLHEGDEIVVEGVTAVRLAETSGAVPEGHSHSH